MKRKIVRHMAVLVTILMVFLNCKTVTAEVINITHSNLRDLLTSKIENFETQNSKHLKGDVYACNSEDENEQDPEEDVRVIVQLAEEPAICKTMSKEYTDNVADNEDDIKASQTKIIKQAEGITGTKLLKQFGYLVNGFSITTKRKNIDVLKKIDGVKSVTEVKTYTKDVESVKQNTGVNSVVNSCEYKGENTVVAVIDSGADYTHKDLHNINTEAIKLNETEADKTIDEMGHGKYFSDKIPYGYNYADGNTDIKDSLSMHGMHVAGIIGANGNDEEVENLTAIKGVAPESQLLIMKVFSNNSEDTNAYDDDIIAAIEDSIKLGADVINMSFGSASGFSDIDDPENKAVERATEAGILCVASCGNKGTATGNSNSAANAPNNLLSLKDFGTIDSPSTAASAFSTASSENDNIMYDVFNIESSTGAAMKALYNTPSIEHLQEINDEYEVVDCGTASNEELSNKDLDGKIALIERNSEMLQEQYDNIAKYNVKGVIFYNNTSDGNYPLAVNIKSVKLPVVELGYVFGDTIKQYIIYGYNKFKLSFGFYEAQNPKQGQMSNFSSWGGTSDLELKPEITAPGGEVNSLGNDNSYVIMGGTSMSSAVVSGEEAVVKQSINEKKLSLFGSELVNFLKNTVMNTAKPMIEGKDGSLSIPYSPRRQGAGLINMEDAVKNNVIITYKDGKGAASLKEVGNKTEFQLTLTNYGTKEAVYNLHKENVYGEKTDTDHLIHEEVLTGSTVEFDKSSVTVNPGEKVTVNVTLNIADNEDADRFVESYLNFQSSDDETPSLSVPFIGFYGEWNKENIIDSPNYDGSDSILGSSGLVSDDYNYYGSYLKDGYQYINKEKTAFSPNGDGIKDEVMPALYFLRNAKTVDIEVLDSKGNIVRKLDHEENVRKNRLVNGVKPNYLSQASWDGSIYDIATGKFIQASDGQYTMRVTSRLDIQNAKDQILDMPLKIDTKVPKVSIKGLEKYADDKGEEHYKLLWQAEDNEGGSGLTSLCEISVNGQVLNVDAEKVTAANGIYSTEIPVTDGEINEIRIAVSDNAGNTASAESREKAGILNGIIISGLSDGMIISEKDLTNKKFIVNGSAADDVGKLEINGKAIDYTDNYFSAAVDVTEEKNIINVYAESKDGKEIINKNYNVMLDIASPEVIVNQDISNCQPYYTTYDDKLSLDISLTDETKCSVKLKNINSNVETQVELNSDNRGTGNIELVNGINKIELSAEDEAGNKTIRTYLVMKGEPDSELSVTMDNLSTMQYLAKDDVNNGVYTIKGHVNKKTGILKINAEQVNINDDLTFAVDIPISEGKNMVKVYAEDEDGKVTADYSYKLFYDETAPIIEFNNLPLMRADEKIYVNKSDFNLKGTLIDNLFSCNLYINGERILKGDNYLYNLGKDIKESFDKHVELKQGENIIKVYAVDLGDNVMKQDLNIVLDTEAPTKPKINLSTNKVTNKLVNITLTSDESNLDRIEYSTDGVNFVKYIGEFSVVDSTTIYARVVDYAGNISDLETADVKIDTTSPEITLNGVFDGQTYYKPITLKAKVDDNNATKEDFRLIETSDNNNVFISVWGMLFGGSILLIEIKRITHRSLNI